MAKSDQHMQKVTTLIITCIENYFRQLLKNCFSVSNYKLNNIFLVSVQIRKKLISKQMILEKSEKAKKLREQRKFGKKVGFCFLPSNM